MTETPQSLPHRLASRLNQALKLEEGELKPLIWSFLYFFSLLCSYYIIRPVRDEMGIQGGAKDLKLTYSLLSTATFVVMLAAVPLFGFTVRRYSRAKLVPRVYYFFIANLLAFFVLFKLNVSDVWVARAFFVWISVFNLFAVSVFWSFMTDLYSSQQADRLFGVIAAGGSTGAIAGPAITALFSQVTGPVNLLPISMLMLFLAVFCVQMLIKDNRANSPTHSHLDAIQHDAVGGSVLSGATRVFRSPYLMGISLFIFMYTTLSTFLYYQQGYIVKDAFTDPAERTTVFAMMDLAVNSLTLLGQLFITSRMVKYLGVGFALMIVPVLVALGFGTLGLFPTLGVLIAFQIVRRAGNYSITRPAREMLYTVVPVEDKYKSKNFIDTVIYRGGDTVSGWSYTGLVSAGIGIGMVPFIALPLALGWAALGIYLGRRRRAMVSAESAPGDGESAVQAD